MSRSPETVHRPTFPWPENILGPRPGLKEINVLCWAMFCLCVVAPACIALTIQYKQGDLYFNKTPVDFIYFYGTGQIANTHPPMDIYNYDLQLAKFNSIRTVKDGVYGRAPYPPFVPEFFRIFANLSFDKAFLLWVSISLLLYLSGLWILLKEFFPEDRLIRSVTLCFALAFAPFLMSTLSNGQLSSIALFFTSVAIVQERRGRFVLSGLALSVLTYKFTLLVWAIPMLLLTRRFKTLGGFAAGSGILGLIASLFTGLEIWPVYLRFLNSFGKTTGVYGKNSIILWKYVDLNSFSYAIPGGRSRIALVLMGCMVIAIVSWLVVVLWRSANGDRRQQTLAWSVAILWTMLANVYYPNYDSVLLVPAVVVCLSALRERQWRGALNLVVTLSIVTFAIGWFTEPLAKRYGVQLLTLAIMSLAVTATYLLQRISAGQPSVAPLTSVAQAG
ncbi:MAG TPA: glycosyltransferase family 87 protein [Terracidiphilus sp.]|jgi:hypothetical protein